MIRRRKRMLPGSREALDEINMAKFHLALDCRLLQSFVREAIRQVKQCERYGSTSNFGLDMSTTATNITMAIQNIVRQGNTARLALKRFHDTTKGE
jgi:hypothetical protein